VASSVALSAREQCDHEIHLRIAQVDAEEASKRSVGTDRGGIARDRVNPW
jgi:hypothetical protein